MTNASLPITVLIAVRNEAVNLARCLSALGPAARVCVIDSFSDDETPAIAARHGAEVIQFRYNGGYPKKRQWALDTLEIGTEWVFLLDADEVVPEVLWDEIRQTLNGANPADAYLITKGFHFMGQRFRYGGFSHSAVLLFRRGQARFETLLEDAENGQDMEVHERLLISGTVGRLENPLIHHDFKGLSAYIDRHNKYSTWEAKLRRQLLTRSQLKSTSVKARLFGNVQEKRRWLKRLAIRMPFEPSLWFLYHYVFRLGFLEGRRGLIASQIRSAYIAQARAKVFELETRERSQIGNVSHEYIPEAPANESLAA